MMNTWLIALKRRIAGLLWNMGVRRTSTHQLPVHVPMSSPASRRLTGGVLSEEEHGTPQTAPQGPSLGDLQQAATQRHEDEELARHHTEQQQN